MRLLGAVGTLVWDTIRHPSTEAPVEQWGGAVYSLAALSAACPPGWRVLPILKVGADLADSALDALRTLPNLELEGGVRVTSEPNNRVELRYLDPARREEVLSGGVPPWSADEILPLALRCDALYLNFLSGFELGLEAAAALRAAFSGPIYADLHSLFLGPPGDGPRPERPLPRAREWLACFDGVQVNESELALLAGGGVEGVEAVLEAGPSLAVATLGEGGARWAARTGDRVEGGLVPPTEGAVEGDPTGCGDVWGSVFWTGILAGLPVEEAIRRAHGLAAAKLRHPSTVGLRERLSAALPPFHPHDGGVTLGPDPGPPRTNRI